MFYYCNNFDYSMNWSQAYQDLNSKYRQLTNDYSKAVELRESLKSKI